MSRVPTFSALLVLVVFTFAVVNLAAETASNGQTPAQQLETPSSIRHHNYSSFEPAMSSSQAPPVATVLFSQPPKPPLHPTPPSVVPEPTRAPELPTTQYFPQTTRYVSTSAAPKDIDSCPPLEGDLDKLSVDQFTTQLTQQCRYDKVTRPDSSEPLPVILQIDIRHIEAIEQLQFKMHMLLQYRYTDYRLHFDDISPKRGIMLGEELLKNKIWIPHIVLSNERESTIMGLEGNDQFVSISPQGEVIFSYRMTATIYCWMDLQKFPFDSQICNLQFRSWTYNASKLVLMWEDEEPVKVANQLHLTEFTLVRYSTFARIIAASLSHGAFVGNYSQLVFEFLLQREIGYYIMEYFIPSILLVSTSWVTFWLQADNAAPRITLGTSTMLAFITLAQGQSKNLPKVSYIKASEIWFLGCTVFIFASMVEFAFVNIIWRRRKKIEMIKVTSKNILKCAITPKLARKELQSSLNNLHKSHSCSSLADCNNINNRETSTSYNNYLTVHSFPSTLNIPAATMQSEHNLINADSQVTIPVPSRNACSNDTHKLQRWASMTPQEVAIWIDKKSRIVFPCAFLVFNIFYWAFVYGL